MQNASPPPEARTPAARRCTLALTLLIADAPLTSQRLCQINHQLPQEAEADLSHLVGEMMRYHALHLSYHPRQGYRLYGSAYEWRLCLLHWLQRGIRLSPERSQSLLSSALQQVGAPFPPETTLARLDALLDQSTPPSCFTFSARQKQIIGLMLLFAYLQHQRHPLTTLLPCWLPAIHRRALQQKCEYDSAGALCQFLFKHLAFEVRQQEQLFTTLMLSLLKNHNAAPRDNEQDRILMQEVEGSVEHVEVCSGIRFPQREQLCSRLFAHLGAAIERARFGIRIGTPLLAELESHHPGLLTLTRDSIAGLERHYRIRFSPEELSLIAVSLGAWLMQAGKLQETAS
ncbi:transcriptional antiterminator [Edwardsiella hoshinae]|uniref:Transcriptional antiterminator n=1 Tax=Edwardsiella hoshinae TaxID=93378 RepID=A0ABN4STB4_9GAMM|nr:PRD domain-containing protein [Edwardsiella hoshinae]AOV96039.1 transcriptional antiterminator [Edwardsiella hoshinae]